MCVSAPSANGPARAGHHHVSPPFTDVRARRTTSSSRPSRNTPLPPGCPRTSQAEYPSQTWSGWCRNEHGMLALIGLDALALNGLDELALNGLVWSPDVQGGAQKKGGSQFFSSSLHLWWASLQRSDFYSRCFCGPADFRNTAGGVSTV